MVILLIPRHRPGIGADPFVNILNNRQGEKNMKRLAVLLLILFINHNSVMGAVATSIPNLMIDGTRYDVTFHPGLTFNDIWDENEDGIFGNDESLLNRSPLFWGTYWGRGTSYSAANAIMHELGDVDGWSLGSDAFCVPGDGGAHYEYPRFVSARCDSYAEYVYDSIDAYDVVNAGMSFSNTTWVSFSPSTVVPLPSTVLLFSSALALISLIEVTRRTSSSKT
jgi:hypothetical protein